MSFTAQQDARCQRGLTWVYRFEGVLDLQRLRAGLPADLLEGIEIWGSRKVSRWLLPRRFELRIGTRDGELRFLHRFSASAAQRASDRAGFERALTAAVGPPG